MSTGLMIGLGLHHKKIDIYRALLESFAYSIKHHVDIAKEAGYLPKRLIATNGGAKSKIFREIISDVLGLQQVHPLREVGSAVGDAYLCGIALNLWEWKDLNNVLRENCEITEPNEENHALYQSFYNLYRKIYPSNKEYMHMLSSGMR
jgi:xylulokinase